MAKPGSKEKAKARQKRSGDRCRKFVFDYLKNNSCADCKESDPLVLEFDHVRGIKYKSVMEMVAPGSIKKIEIEKCDVVCANCHTRRTYHLDQNGYRVRTKREVLA